MITIQWDSFRAFNPGEHVGIMPLDFFRDNGIKVFRKQDIHEAAIAFEIDRLPEPCPNFIHEIKGFKFTKRATTFIVQDPINLGDLREWLEKIYDFAKENQDTATWGINLDTDRSISIYVKEIAQQ